MQTAECLEYQGETDVTVWLQELNGDDPVIYPEWPQKAGYAAVGLRWAVDKRGVFKPFLIVALTRAGMLKYRQKGCLWFCNIPIKDLVTKTDAKEGWFDGSTISG